MISGTIQLCSDEKGCGCPGRPENAIHLLKEGDLAVTGGAGNALVRFKVRKRCEALLPDFSEEIGHTVESVINKKFSVLETSSPATGYYSYTCLSQYKRQMETNAEGEEVFVGVIAIASNVTRYASESQAAVQFRDSLVTLPGGALQAVDGIGEEASLSSVEATNSKGEPEYATNAYVRVRNVTAYFKSLAGDGEAGEGPARGLLAQVAGEL